MNKKLLFSIFFLIIIQSNYAFNTENDTLKISENKKLIEKEDLSFVHFPELEQEYPIVEELHPSNTPDFSFENIKREFPINNEIIDSRRKAAESFQKIENQGKWIDSFGSEDIKVLPIGIKKGSENGGVEYSMAITKVKILPQYSELTVYAKITLPQSDEEGNPIELFFGANNVRLSRDGGLTGDANLLLLGDIQIPFNGGSWLLSLKGDYDSTNGTSTSPSFVTINCDGFKELGLQGEVQFSRDVIVPVNDKGDLLPETRSTTNLSGETVQVPNRVRGEFNIVATDWNDMIVDIDLSPFVLSDQEDKFMFSVNNAIFDFSDLRTENVSFPQYYRDNDLLLPSEDNWRGVFVQSLQVSMPKEFKTNTSISENSRVEFEARNMIIDNYGVSGIFSADNLIPIEEGRTDNQKAWAFSVDEIEIEVAANNLIGAEFEGRIILPIDNSSDTGSNEEEEFGLGYRGVISEAEYSMTVSIEDEIDFSVWEAKAILLPNSSIVLSARNGKFYPRANLNGAINISTSLGDSNTQQTNNNSEEENNIEFNGIQFQDLVLQSNSPVFEVGYFGYNGSVNIMNFPVSIADIALTTEQNEVKLGFEVRLNLMGEDDQGFGASTRLEIVGSYRDENKKLKIVYDHVELKRVSINADMGGFKIDGSLIVMNNDPEYGDGFSAELNVELAALQGTTIEAKAIFGKTDFRYWYFDMLVDNLPTGSGTPITLKGIGGGAFYRMERSGFSSAYSPSGLSYLPNGNMGLGLKAMVLFGIVSDKAINGGAGFEISFNRNGGINKMGFYGEAHVMQDFSIPNPAEAITGKMTEAAEITGADSIGDSSITEPFVDKAKTDYPATISGEAGINGYIGIEYDFQNETLHGELDIYVNVAGGVVAGRASGGRAGWAVIHLSPEEWYLHMGTPQDRLGLNVGFGSVSLEAGGYFMIGDNIPASPPPPPEISEILGVDQASLDYMSDENSIMSNGEGFAFGHDFRVDTGDLSFLMFYGRFMAGGGMDVMLKNYGQARCANTNDQVGINGWYANGQAYTYIQGEVGLHVKLFMIDKKMTILKIGAAALLQAKAPNPIWMEGNVGGNYDILGGLVKGTCNFKVTIGEKCEFENAPPLGDIKFISDLTPTEGRNEVDVFVAPQATFALQIDEPMVIPTDEGDKTYKAILEKFKVIDESGNELPGELEWSDTKDRVTYILPEVLPSTARMKVEVEVSFQELINGRFEVIMIDGQKATELETRNFTTGEAPTYIPLHNIVYCYPVIEQQQFYKREGNKGYVQLKSGQNYLFDNNNWISEIKFIDENGNINTAPINYSNTNKKVSFQIPAIDNSRDYLLSIVSTPRGAENQTTNPGITSIQSYNENENSVEITKKNAANVSRDGEIDRLSYDFRTSEYNTFRDKINDIRVSDHLWGKLNPESSDVIFLTSNINNHEGFELLELSGNNFTNNNPLVLIESRLNDTYFEDDIDPVIYQNYGPNDDYTIRRDQSEYGFRPNRAVLVRSDYLSKVEYGSDPDFRATRFPFRYNLPYVYKQDYIDIKNHVLNDYLNGLIPDNSRFLAILDEDFKFMRYGDYDVVLKYQFPDGSLGSNANFSFKNLLRIR